MMTSNAAPMFHEPVFLAVPPRFELQGEELEVLQEIAYVHTAPKVAACSAVDAALVLQADVVQPRFSVEATCTFSLSRSSVCSHTRVYFVLLTVVALSRVPVYLHSSPMRKTLLALLHSLSIVHPKLPHVITS